MASSMISMFSFRACFQNTTSNSQQLSLWVLAQGLREASCNAWARQQIRFAPPAPQPFSHVFLWVPSRFVYWLLTAGKWCHFALFWFINRNAVPKRHVSLTLTGGEPTSTYRHNHASKRNIFHGNDILYIDFDGFYLFIILLLCHMGYGQAHKEHNRRLSDASFSVGTNLQGGLDFFSPFCDVSFNQETPKSFQTIFRLGIGLGYEQTHNEHHRRLSNTSLSVGTLIQERLWAGTTFNIRQGGIEIVSPCVLYHSLHNLKRLFVFYPVSSLSLKNRIFILHGLCFINSFGHFKH